MLFFCVITLIFPNLIYSQNVNPGDDEIFKEFEVTEIRVTMSDSDMNFLLAEENAYSNDYVTADVMFSNSELTRSTVNNVGIRLRGGTSRERPKKAFKIDFKEFGGGQFYGYKKINLKPEANDPSLVRELLTMHLYRLMNVPAPRVAPAVLYFNEEYMGVYLMVEQIDDEFVDRRFGGEGGYLYKCGIGATLEDDGQVYNTLLFESKMNEDTDARVELDSFVTALNTIKRWNLKRDFERYFAVDRYLRQLAVEAITGHWDGYSWLNNNFYLYYNDDEGRFEFMPYDTDSTWGIDWVSEDWATRDLTNFYKDGRPRPLTSRILSVKDWNARYIMYLNTLFDKYFTPEYLYPLFDQLEGILDPHVLMDERFDDSFDFSYEDFKDSFDQFSEGHVEYGLRSFVETRRLTGMSSIPDIVLGVSYHDENLVVYPNPTSDGTIFLSQNISLEVKVFDVNGRRVKSEYSKASGSLQISGSPGVYFIHVGEQVKKVVKQ